MEGEGMVGGNVTTRPLLVKKQSNSDDISPTHINDVENENCSNYNSSAVTPLLVLSTTVAAIVCFSSGFIAGYSAPAETGIVSDLSLSVEDYSVFGSVLTIGALVGALSSGKVADLFGHRISVWVLNLFYITAWLAIIFAKENLYIAEVTPKNLRGGFMTLNQLMTGISIAFAYVVGSIVSWRSLALIGSIVCVMQIFGVIFIPESPRWLREFEATLQRLRGAKANISQEATDIKSFTEELRLMSEDKILDLFQRKYAYAITIGVGLMVLRQLSGSSGFIFYMTTIFDMAGFPSQVGFIVVAITEILLNILGIILIDKLGRRTLLMVSAAGTCLGSFLVGSSFIFQDLHRWKEATPYLALIGVLVFMGTLSLGLGGIPWIIVSEIFPINVKGSAGGLCNTICWLSTWAVSYTFNFSLEWSSAGTFFIFSSISGFGLLFIIMLVPETKGRALEEIQASITGSTSER